MADVTQPPGVEPDVEPGGGEARADDDASAAPTPEPLVLDVGALDQAVLG